MQKRFSFARQKYIEQIDESFTEREIIVCISSTRA